ncbi:MAG: hypothetical protein FWD66_00045 [Paludibacter sp.]|nr:hypothetical protein [Paludibacter sp.]
MKKIFLLFFALATTFVALNAQDTPKSFDYSANLDKKTSGTCVSVKVNADLKTAISVMQDLLKKEGFKDAKKKGNNLQAEKTVFPTISTDYINIYFGFVQTSKDKKNPQTTVNVFVSKGTDNNFLNAVADPQLNANLKTFLDTKYVPAMYNDNVDKLREAKQKGIDKTKSDLDNLNKTIDKRTKDISGYEKDIDKANDNIKKAKSDIESSKKQIETSKALLQKQQDELKAIK